MGITERKERDKQEMRKNIIDAAMHMFTQEGYENASIRKIADKIEYSPATIYLYYKDKDELLYDVQGECFSELVEIFRKKATAEDPFVRLGQISKAYVTYGLDNPQTYDLMFTMKSPMNNVEKDEVWQNADDAFGLLAKCIHECIGQGLIRFDHVLLGALSVWSMGHGLISLNNSCRMKVMNMDEEQVRQSVFMAIETYLNQIRK
jgi:AcrR family transcriptional regulator